MEQNNYNVEEREISLLDLLFDVMLKWRSILVVAIVFTLLAGTYSYISSMKTMDAMEDVELADIELTDDEYNNVKEYIDYYNTYKIAQKYNEESPYMKLSPDGYYESVLQYYVSVDETTEESTQYAMTYAYKTQLESEEYTKEISAILGDDIKEEYYNEVILFEDKMTDVAVSGKYKIENLGMIQIVVRHNDYDICKAISDVTAEQIKGLKSQIANKYGEHELVANDYQVNFTVGSGIIVDQANNVKKIREFLATLTIMKKEFSVNQQAYIDTYFEDELGIVDSEEKQEVVLKPSISKKLVVIGFVGGAALMVMLYAFAYIFNGRIRVEDNFENIFGVKVLGNITFEEKKKKKLFGFVDQIICKFRHANLVAFSMNQGIPMIVSNIKIACERENKSEITLIYDSSNQSEEDVSKEVITSLDEQGIKVAKGNTVLFDYTALESAAKTSMVVMIKSAGKAGYKMTQKEIDIYRGQGTKIVGAIIVTE